jgi:glutamate-1-semialdehyde aminotransferase
MSPLIVKLLISLTPEGSRHRYLLPILTAAIRLARTHTGEEKILRFGYHGWHDWRVLVPAGVPDKVRGDIIPFKCNDIDSVTEALDRFKGELAAVILTPLAHEFNRPIEFPPNGFLKKLLEITIKEG